MYHKNKSKMRKFSSNVRLFSEVVPEGVKEEVVEEVIEDAVETAVREAVEDAVEKITEVSLQTRLKSKVTKALKSKYYSEVTEDTEEVEIDLDMDQISDEVIEEVADEIVDDSDVTLQAKLFSKIRRIASRKFSQLEDTDFVPNAQESLEEETVAERKVSEMQKAREEEVETALQTDQADLTEDEVIEVQEIVEDEFEEDSKTKLETDILELVDTDSEGDPNDIEDLEKEIEDLI